MLEGIAFEMRDVLEAQAAAGVEVSRKVEALVDVNDACLVAEYVDWYNHRRLHGELGLVHPPSTRRSTTPTTPSGRASAGDNSASTKPGA